MINRLNLLHLRLFVTVIAAALFSTAVTAADLFYDPSAEANSDWLSDLWGASDEGPYTGAWADGNKAVFNAPAARTYVLGGNVAVSGIEVKGTNAITLSGFGGTRTLNLDGATIKTGGTRNGALNLDANLVVTGDFEVTGGGLRFNVDATSLTFTGSVLVKQGGQILFDGGFSTGNRYENAHFIAGDSTAVTGTLMRFGGGTRLIGGLEINGGIADFGAAGASPASFTVKQLSGDGGTLTLRSPNGEPVVAAFTVDQATDTIFSGSIAGVVGPIESRRGMTFTKSGVGSLTMNGSSLNLRDGTFVNGGSLLINGAGTRDFEAFDGETAISVGSTGLLGGTSMLTIYGGDDVLVESGGGLTAGAEPDAIGALTFSYDDGGSLVLGGGTLNLIFDLGDDTVDGTTFDQIRVIGGTFDIGAGTLDFDDFAFNAKDGFGIGTYLLFALTDSELEGELGGNVTGAIGDYVGTLSIDDSGLVLSVTAVPEPRQIAFAFALVVLLTAVLRRKRM